MEHTVTNIQLESPIIKTVKVKPKKYCKLCDGFGLVQVEFDYKKRPWHSFPYLCPCVEMNQ